MQTFIADIYRLYEQEKQNICKASLLELQSAKQNTVVPWCALEEHFVSSISRGAALHMACWNANHRLIMWDAAIRYEGKLTAERDMGLRLKGENGIMKKRFSALQKDIDEAREECKALFDQKKELYQACFHLP